MITSSTIKDSTIKDSTIKDSAVKDSATGLDLLARGHVGVTIRRRMQQVVGVGLLLVLTLSAIALREDTALPWTATGLAGRVVGGLSASMVLVGGIAVGLMLLGGVRLALGRRNADPDARHQVAAPVSLRWWQRPAWALVVACLLVAPFAVLWILRRSDPTTAVPMSAPSPGLSAPPVTPGGPMMASPAVQATVPTDTTLWPVLVVLGLVTVIAVIAVWRIRRLRAARAEPPTHRRPGAGGQAPSAAQPTTDLTGDAREAVVACYLQMERQLADRGLRRHPGETPSDLLRRAALDDRVAARAGRQLCALYDEARFSDHPLVPSRRNDARAALQQVEDALEYRS